MASSSKSDFIFNNKSGSQSKLDKFFAKQQNHALSTCEKVVIHKNPLFSLFSNSDNQQTTAIQSVISESNNLSATVLL